MSGDWEPNSCESPKAQPRTRTRKIAAVRRISTSTVERIVCDRRLGTAMRLTLTAPRRRRILECGHLAVGHSRNRADARVRCASGDCDRHAAVMPGGWRGRAVEIGDEPTNPRSRGAVKPPDA